MKTIELVTGNDKKDTMVFIDQITYIRPKKENETWIVFNDKNQIIAHISYQELISKIKQL